MPELRLDGIPPPTMRKTIAFISLPEFAHYLDAVMSRLEGRGYAVEIRSPEQAKKNCESLLGMALVGTVHSVLADVRDVMTALKGRVPSLTLQDGSIEYRPTLHVAAGGVRRHQPLQTDQIAVFGDRSAAMLMALGVAPDRIARTGSCRIHREAPPPPPPSEGGLLITASNRPAFEPEGTARFYRMLDHILVTCRDHDIPYRLRLSRGLKGRRGLCRIETVADHLDPALIRRFREAPISQTDLAQDIRAARAVLTTPSTVSLEAMAQGRAVGHYLFDDEPAFLNAAWVIRPGSDVAALISGMMDPPTLKRQFQESLLWENLVPGDAPGRIADHIEWMIANRERFCGTLS